MCVGLLVDIL